jgi:hypothetical protein
MNGTLIYTYQWDDTAPTSTFVYTGQKSNGQGEVGITIRFNDTDGNDLRAKLEYVAGADCDFASPLDPILATSSITADFGTPAIDNNFEYQIGTTSNWIRTSSGENNVSFDWLTKIDLDNLEGIYCLKVTSNDLGLDQTNTATATVLVDNIKPTVPGQLSFNTRSDNSITLNFGATTTETNFKEYKIYYKLYDGSEVTESDNVLSSSTDSNLGDILFKEKATTTIGELLANTYYSFSIFAYDLYGNMSSSSRFEAKTSGQLTSSIKSISQKPDGSGAININFDLDDPNEGSQLRAAIEYVPGSDCNFFASSITCHTSLPYIPLFGATAITTLEFLCTVLGKSTC